MVRPVISDCALRSINPCTYANIFCFIDYYDLRDIIDYLSCSFIVLEKSLCELHFQNSAENFDPAIIFKGTKKQTGAIPGHKEGFETWQELYDEEGEHEICFMQNKGKLSTNDTMVQWFKEHFIPSVHGAKEKRRSQGELVSNKYVVILDGVSTHCLSQKSGTNSWITELQEHDPDLILLWLPPNMTGDLQPLDVNFNKPFKAQFRPILARLKKKRRDEESFNPQMENASRENSSAQKLKAVVIEGIVNAHKSIPKGQIEKGWTKAGKYVYEDNGMGHNGSGYYSAWDKDTQNDDAKTRYTAGTLFFEGMTGGISDIGGNLQFIPRAGRKRKQTTQGTDQIDEGMEQSVEETAASSQQFSEYDSSQCPDEFIDEETPEDMIVEPMPD